MHKYEFLLTEEFKTHVIDAVLEAITDGDDCAHVDYDGYLSKHVDSLTEEQYKDFDWQQAEIFLMNHVQIVEDLHGMG